MKKTAVFEGTYAPAIEKMRKMRVIGFKEILDIIAILRTFEMDCQVVIAGQNGVGKSILQNIMLKAELGDSWMDNLIMGDKLTADIVQLILENENTLLGIDELNLYLNYRKHSESDQQHLLNTFELARENAIGVLGCVRDPRKLTLNYRNGKMTIVIWVLDRFREGGSYAAVFIANPAIESSMRFGFDWLDTDLQSFDRVRAVIENQVTSFVCYMKIPDAKEYLTTAEIKKYRAMKKVAKAAAHLEYLIRQLNRKKISRPYFDDALAKLRPMIDEGTIEKYLKMIIEPKKKKGGRFNDIEREVEDG